MLINTTMSARRAAAFSAARAQGTAMCTAIGSAAHLAYGAVEFQGITVSPARVRGVQKATALLPKNDVVVTDGISGTRPTWSPPV